MPEVTVDEQPVRNSFVATFFGPNGYREPVAWVSLAAMAVAVIGLVLIAVYPLSLFLVLLGNGAWASFSLYRLGRLADGSAVGSLPHQHRRWLRVVGVVVFVVALVAAGPLLGWLRLAFSWNLVMVVTWGLAIVIDVQSRRTLPLILRARPGPSGFVDRMRHGRP